MTDLAHARQNFIAGEKIVDNCVVTYLNDYVWTENCASPYGFFPYKNKNTSYQIDATTQKNEVMQISKYKVEKKSTTVFEKYYLKEQKNNKDAYELITTYQLNENGLMSEITNGEYTMKIVYSYFQ